MDGLMNARAHDLRGIVNGIDYDVFNPETDNLIAQKYNAVNFRKEKVKNKLKLQEELGLDKDPGTMMIGIVSRLTDQKGFDLYKGQYDLASIDWKKGEIKYDNNFQPRLKGLDANHIALSDIHLGIDSLHFCSPDLSVVIRQCKMKEKSGIVLALLTGKAVMDSTRLHLHRIAMKTPTSDLQAEVAIDLNVMDEKNPGQMNADLSASLSKEDLLLAMGDMPVAFRRQ